MRCAGAMVASMLAIGCGRANTPAAGGVAATPGHSDDSLLALRTRQAPAFADTARTTMATLLKHPESAVFDSLIVVQPPEESGSWPAPFVCGRIGGKPGIGGRNTPTPFIYRNRLTVFVLDQNNGAAFAALRAKDCDGGASQVLLR